MKVITNTVKTKVIKFQLENIACDRFRAHGLVIALIERLSNLG